ncbi:NADH pyrophosphatase [Klebsiella pneumoniae]|uniref:NADH pyrophosphatase n=1 Tax=Klebsiella pneumoniae TaxID=573 RepID=A0A447RST9_KLEPN|nr:NADH pyrophosphatase [Klebsiella pneumoniae]
MTAFMADYADGEIVVDKKELLTADWYRYDDLPLLPPPGDSGAAAYRRYRRDVSGRVRVTCYTGRIQR